MTRRPVSTSAAVCHPVAAVTGVARPQDGAYPRQVLRTRLASSELAACRPFSPVRVIRAAISPATSGAEKDGPLHRAIPYRVIFSSCDSGVLAPAGADELLGLAHTLAPRGTAGIVASVVPVNDQATAKLMVPLHRYLRDGASLAEALRLARDGAEREPVLAATAWSFLALGAA
jgi:CHAT domain